MGAIARTGGRSGELIYLHTNHVVGRAENCDLILAGTAISSRHAEIRWTPQGCWTILDLSSLNGTFVNGKRLIPRVAMPGALAAGDVVMFADSDETWKIEQADAPCSLLVPAGKREPLYFLHPGQILALPSGEDVAASVYQNAGNWYLERKGEAVPLVRDQVVEVAGTSYRAHLVSWLPPTEDLGARLLERRASASTFEIRVASDEESAEAWVRFPTEDFYLRRRGHLYLLAYLCRERLQNPDSGWVEVNEICRRLPVSSPETLNVLVHRCRKDLEEAGIADPASLIDRSRRGFLRICLSADRITVKSD